MSEGSCEAYRRTDQLQCKTTEIKSIQKAPISASNLYLLQERWNGLHEKKKRIKLFSIFGYKIAWK